MTNTDPTGRAETPAAEQQTCAEKPTLGQKIETWTALQCGYPDEEIREVLGVSLDYIATARQAYNRKYGRV